MSTVSELQGHKLAEGLSIAMGWKSCDIQSANEMWQKVGLIFKLFPTVSITKLSAVEKNRTSAGTIGDGDYEAHVCTSVVRADDPTTALFRAVVYHKFGSTIEL